jgi:hypothetical protein
VRVAAEATEAPALRMHDLRVVFANPAASVRRTLTLLRWPVGALREGADGFPYLDLAVEARSLAEASRWAWAQLTRDGNLTVVSMVAFDEHRAGDEIVVVRPPQPLTPA